MRKTIALTTLALALFAFGCAGYQTAGKGEAPVTKGTKIRCPKCGAEFTVGEGLSELEKAR